MNPARRTLAFSLAAALAVGMLGGILLDRLVLWDGPYPVQVLEGMGSVDEAGLYVESLDDEDLPCGFGGADACGFNAAGVPGADCLEGSEPRRVQVAWLPADPKHPDYAGAEFAVWVRCLD